MSGYQLGPRERILSIWAKNRLDERETVDWGVGALKTIRGELGADMVALFRLLDREAQKSGIDADFMTLWRLFRIAAEEGAFSYEFLFVHELGDKIKENTLRREDIDQLVEIIRPRLKAESHSSFDGSDGSPLNWVRWKFEIALNDSSIRRIGISRRKLSALSADSLRVLLDKGTSALQHALSICSDIGWTKHGSDVPNLTVRRVWDLDEADDANDEDKEDKDPDAYDDQFAPIARMLSSAQSALAQKEPHWANRVLDSWNDQARLSGLFLRLAAFGSWNSRVRSPTDVGEFLISLSDRAFWRWSSFPEVATLRAKRWNEFDDGIRRALSLKILKGPDDLLFTFDGQVDPEAKEYHRDHEIARLVDSSAHVDDQFKEIVAQRRASDPNFPATVPLVELGLPPPRVTWVTPGRADKFDEVQIESLLATLASSHETRGFGQGDDAEAFARTLTGKARILDALSVTKRDEPVFPSSLDMILSFADDKPEDALVEREIATRIIHLALQLSASELNRNVNRFCYWLNAIDNRVNRLDDVEGLWTRLLPLAEQAANKKDGADHYPGESDLTMAALNEPLGHLLSFVLHRCSPIKKGKHSHLPYDLLHRLNQLSGRARELWANRMAVAMNYFVLVDEKSLNEIVIDPMLRPGPEGDRLWEAFARYGQVPSVSLWRELETGLLGRLHSVDLTPDSKRRLGEMCVIAWVWSCRGRGYSLKAASLRNALSLSNDDVRSAAAWQFSSMFRGDAEQPGTPSVPEMWNELGRRFFDEVWPLEPALQCPSTANDFASIPGSLGSAHFAEAVSIITPFLVPFNVWSVATEFDLDISEDKTRVITQFHGDELLTLLSLSISEVQGHGVFDLGGILDQILAFNPKLDGGDYRVQKLRKMAGGIS